MTEPQESDDEKQRDDTLRQMLKTPPKPHKGQDMDASPDNPSGKVEDAGN